LSALSLGDYVVTEAGFGADLGAEKFMDIKCRMGNIKPSAIVIVATVRALKMHGGVPKAELGAENVEALTKGFENLKTHIENIKKFGVTPVVAINHFVNDTDAEVSTLKELTEELGVKAIISKGWAEGGKGVTELAEEIVKVCDQPNDFHQLYPLEMPLEEKIETIAKNIYRAKAVDIQPAAAKKLKAFADAGYGNLPVCIAKTQNSISHEKTWVGAPKDYVLPIREVRLSAGAGFVVALAGDIMTMPGLPKVPAAEAIDVDDDGVISGLF
jgi:formate--tetrahydrofolate ligase